MTHRMLRSILIVLLLSSPAGLYAGNYLTFTSQDEVTAGDISVQVDGKPAEVMDFFQVDASSENPAFSNHPAGRRQLFFLYDLIFSRAQDVLAARKATLEFLEKAGREDLISLSGITSAGLKIYCAPTADRNQIIAGLNAIGKDKLEGMMAGPEGNLYPTKFDPGVFQQPVEDDDFLKNLKPLGLEEKRKQEHAFILIQGLVDLSYSLSAVHGRKVVIVFSPGCDTKDVSLNLDLEQKRSDTRNPSSTESEPASLDSITNSYRNIEDVAAQGPARRPRQHGVEIIPELYEGTDSHVYAVTLSGEESGFLKDLSSRTGGQYFRSSVNADQVLSAERKFFVVEWQDSARKEWKALNSVKISAGSHKIVSSEKWFLTRPPAEQTPEEKRMHIAECVYKDFQKPSASDRFWVDFVFEEGHSKIPSFVQVPGSELLKLGNRDVKLEFYSYVLDRDGSVLDSSVVPVSLELSNESLRTRITTSGLKVWSLLLGEERPLVVRQILIQSDTGQTTTHSVYLDVKSEGLAMSNPFIPATDFSWILWPKPQEELTRRGVTIRYPYRMGQDFFFPDLSPELKPGPSARVVYFRLYNLLPESKNPPVRFHLLDARGQAVEIQDFHLMQKPRDLEHSGKELFWDLSTVPSVPPGAYRVKIGIQDALRKQVVVREVQNLVVPGS